MSNRDWQELNSRDQRRALRAWGALYAGGEERIRDLAGHSALTDEDAPARAKPVQREHAEGVELMVRASRTSWGRYLRHHEQAVRGRRAGARRRQAGQAQGWPDYTLIVPGWAPMLAALELKAPSRRPVNDPGPLWWLEWAMELDSDREQWELRANAPTRHGVSAYQAICLWELSGAGFETKVAYGACEAFEWLCGLRGDC